MDNVAPKSNADKDRLKAKAHTQGILVFGMHRSGTSACARVLNMLGCSLSEKLIGAGDGNEAGHWEAIDAVALNDEILSSAGSSHDDWGPINPDWRGSAVRSQMVERASAVIKDHARLGPLFALKDPRMCRLGDVWIEAAIAAEVDPLVVVMLRNPLEVIESLEVRDLMATGYAELLWLRHVLDAEHFSRGSKRVFFRYDQLLNNWQGLITKCKDGLGVALPRNSPRVHAEIGHFLSQSQRHHHVDPAVALNDATRSPWLREAFGIMLRWSDSGEDPADYPALDDMRAELDRSYGVFARMLLSEGMTGEVASGRRLRDQVSLLQQDSAAHAEALRMATEAAESERAAAHQREADLAAALDQAQVRLAAVEAEIAAQQEARLAAEHQHAEALRHASEATEGERAAAHHREADLAAALSQAQASLAAIEAEIAAERQARLEADHRHAAVLGDLHKEQLRNAEIAGQLASLQSAIVQRQEELAQLLAQFHEAENARLRAELETERERDQRLALEQGIAAAHAQVAALQQQLAQAQAAAGEQVDALNADLAQLTLMLKAQEEAAEQAAAEATASLAEGQRLSQKVADLTNAASTAEAARSTSERKLAARFDELARLTAIVTDEMTRADTWENASQWLSDVRRVEEGFPAWWTIMPSSWRQRRAHRRYLGASLFDAAAYLALYPDVAEQGMDPIRHYILHGMAEGRTRTQPS